MTKKQVHDALLICADNGCCVCPYAKHKWCASELKRDAAALLEETSVFDQVEEYQNCTVQVLRNSKTGECSVGWWKKKPEVIK